MSGERSLGMMMKLNGIKGVSHAYRITRLFVICRRNEKMEKKHQKEC